VGFFSQSSSSWPFAQAVLMPLALAVLLAFLLTPIVNMLQRAGSNRAIAVALTTIVSFALLAGLLYVVAYQFLGLVEDLPLYRDNLRAKIGMLSGPASSGLEQSARRSRSWAKNYRRRPPAR
jgi:predicted PurR-regulated permease PerM